ncbi:MAG TPA: accessory Sec system S-layer assembly protein [Chondromyces sp.]|nr:accessory Sec system S-layer assembly protein [Chondromyces sp.]
MFSFFKKKKNLKKEGQDNTVSAGDLLEETNNESNTDEDVETELSIHPQWNVPREKEYVFRFLNNELPPLKPNQLSLAGLEWMETDKGLEVTAFVRNSLAKSIQLKETELLLLNDKNEVVAGKTFDLSLLDTLPPKSSRPWMFLFERRNPNVELNRSDWTLAFKLPSEHKLDLDPSWEESLPEGEKEKLQKIFDSLPKLGKSELNFTGLTAQRKENQLAVSLFIRNGYDRDIELNQLPLQVIDATGETVAQGGFKLDLKVKANTTKPWTFIFPENTIQKAEPDFSKWSVRVKQ